NGGQTCTAWTRMLVHQDQYEQALDLAKGFADGFVPGDPLDPSTKLGPLVSRAQLERVRGFIDTGLAEGARLVTGGTARPDGAGRGHYIAATVLGDVDQNATVAQEEIFGPVLSVIPFRDEDEALRIANNSRYGLSGAVWAADQDRAVAFARRVRTGSVDVNGGAYNPMAP
ncbi:aldehyde dehydrogenase family protein, partial [Klebsiella pneumoniae]